MCECSHHGGCVGLLDEAGAYEQSLSIVRQCVSQQTQQADVCRERAELICARLLKASQAPLYLASRP